MEVTDPSYFGELTFGESETVELDSAGHSQQTVTVTRAHGEWRPPARYAEFFPDGFSVPIQCDTGHDGIRRIVADCSCDELIDLGAVGGLAILHGINGFDPNVDHSYREMQKFHQYVRGRAYCGQRGMKEHWNREFRYSRDLFIRRTGRVDEWRDVLPDNIGLDSNGQGHRLSVKQLTELGRVSAREAGHSNPTSEQAIAYGLFEAAKRKPLHVDDARVSDFVSAALYDIESHQTDPKNKKASKLAPSEEVIKIVWERFHRAIARHFDDSSEKFDKWFCGPSNSLVKQIAQQKSKPGGRLEREEVRQALLHLGWRAYQYVGNCLNAMMRTIRNSMPDPLNEKERQLFERMHERQPYYGNVPLILLLERSRFLQLPVLAIWNEPDNEDHIPVLHRVLAYYAHMVPKRRQADQQSKQRRPGGSSQEDHTVGQTIEGEEASCAADADVGENQHPSSGHLAVVGQLIDNLHSCRSVEETPFARIGEQIRESCGIFCDQGCTEWEHLCDDPSSDPVTLTMQCACGAVSKEIRMSRDEFAARAERALGWTRQGRPAANLATNVDKPTSES